MLREQSRRGRLCSSAGAHGWSSSVRSIRLRALSRTGSGSAEPLEHALAAQELEALEETR